MKFTSSPKLYHGSTNRRMNCFILDIIAGASLEICEQQKKGNMESVQHISLCTHITAGKYKIE